MSRIKQLFGETIVYGVSSVLTRFLNLLLLPLYTNILTPDEYGVLNILNTTFSLLWLISVLALDSASFVFFHDYDEEEKRKRIFSSWFWIQFLTGLLLCMPVFFASGPLSELFFGEDTFRTEFRLISLLIMFNLLPSIIWNWLRSKRKVKATAIFTIIQSVIIIGCNVWFILGLKLGIKGFFYAQLVSGFIMSIAAIIMLGDWISTKYFDKFLLKRMLLFSLPLVPTAVASWGLNSTGGYFIQARLGAAEVGLYQTGITLSGILAFVTTSFTQAWGPFAMSVKDQADSTTFYARMFIVYISVIGVMAAGVLIFSRDILHIITSSEYEAADWVAGLLSFNALLIGLNYIASIGLNIVKNMKPFAIVSILGSFFNLILFYYGALLFGKEGCAVASLISNTGISVFIFRAAQKKFPIPFDFIRGAMIFLLCLGSGIAIKYVVESEMGNQLIFRLAGFFLLFCFLLFLNKESLLMVKNKIRILRKQY
ncbi:MAG: oligosaccharide flippase family protein [Chitinophagaceae bacterium]|nr:oligosaccharide flippase family protein [Chitinophagaceae bacterium]